MSKSKMPSFDSKLYPEFLKSEFGKKQEDYSNSRPGGNVSPSAQQKYQEDFAIFAATGRGGEPGSLVSKAANKGMSPAELAHYAKKSEAKNFNSLSDLKEAAKSFKGEKLGGDNAKAIALLNKQMDKLKRRNKKSDQQTEAALEPDNYEPSEAYTNALAGVNSYESDLRTPTDTRDSELGIGMANLNDQPTDLDTDSASPIDDTKAEQSQQFANDYTFKVKDGIKFAGLKTRGPNSMLA